jgi:aryl-alcohol dehydrogenase-like predicted oxidoreductase
MRTLDSLVVSGKVRYIGVSYAPAWKIAQAQTMAAFRDWAPFVGLQIEYSLLQRTIEDELVPMAAEHGLGITPWSPLKGGLLSGKYNTSTDNPGTGTRFGDTGRKTTLSNKEQAILEQLREISVTHGITVAAVALAWVIGRPGVASTIVGVRTKEQLQQNLTALDVTLTRDEIHALDNLSAPPATFVNSYRDAGKMFHHGGIEVNGYRPAVLPLTQNMTPGKY